MLAATGTRRNLERDARASFHESIPVAYRAHAPSRLEATAARAMLEVRHFEWHGTPTARFLGSQQDLDAQPSIRPVTLTMETEEILRDVVSTSKTTMLVRLLTGHTVRPATSPKPSASERALTWSSARRSTIVLNATIPAAAIIPAWRIPPPNIPRIR